MDFPKMLFPDGDPTQEYRIVADAEEETAAIKAGYRVAYSAAPTIAAAPVAQAVDAPRRRGRPPKAKP
jgi:hypothetical protein